MIDDEERSKRQHAYENAKANSRARGVELTPETEALMKQYINGDIGQEVFFAEIWKVAGQAFGPPIRSH
jgi:hypothetical protein